MADTCSDMQVHSIFDYMLDTCSVCRCIHRYDMCGIYEAKMFCSWAPLGSAIFSTCQEVTGTRNAQEFVNFVGFHERPCVAKGIGPQRVQTEKE